MVPSSPKSGVTKFVPKSATLASVLLLRFITLSVFFDFGGLTFTPVYGAPECFAGCNSTSSRPDIAAERSKWIVRGQDDAAQLLDEVEMFVNSSRNFFVQFISEWGL